MDRILSVGADLGFKERTMPVEARRETFRDPGSTPGASTIFEGDLSRSEGMDLRMARRSRKSGQPSLDGGLVVWKPRGPSSRAVVNHVQRQLGVRGLGHCGTLDPLASGVMVLTGGLASKFQQWLTIHDKSYIATIWWGLGSESGDAEGPLWTPEESVDLPSLAEIREALPRFLGEQQQIPPRHSAIRIDGRRSYDSARSGEELEMKPRAVRIDDLELLEQDGHRCRLRVDCGPGTYIRSLVRDLGEALEIPATLMGLQRTACGVHTLSDAVRLDQVQRKDVWNLERIVEHLPRREFSTEDCRRLGQGQQVEGDLTQDSVAWCEGRVQGIVEVGAEGEIKARRWLSRGVREIETDEGSL